MTTQATVLLGAIGTPARRTLTPRVKALLALLGLLGLGILERTRVMTRHDLHVDRRVAALLVWAVTDLVRVRRRAAILLRDPALLPGAA